MSLNLFLDAHSWLLILGILPLSFLASREPAAALATARSVILPLGAAATTLKIHNLLRSMESPEQFAPATAAAFVPCVLAALAKIGLDLVAQRMETQNEDSNTAPNTRRSRRRSRAAAVACLLLVHGLFAGPHWGALLNFEILALVSATGLLVFQMSKRGAVQKDNYASTLLQSTLPVVGLLISFGALLVVAANRSDPPTIGLNVSIGLMGLLYCMVIWVFLRLSNPTPVSSDQGRRQWPVFMAAMAALGSHMLIVWDSLRLYEG